MFKWIACLSSMMKFAIRAVMTALVLLILPGVLSIILPGLKGHVVFDMLSIKAAQAAIAYVQQNGSVTSNSGSPVTSVNVSITNAPTVGNTIIVSVATDYSSGSMPGTPCTDDVGNTYTVDVQQLHGSPPNRPFVMICSAEIATGQVPATITISHHDAYNRVVQVHEFSGIASAPAGDKANSAVGSSTSPSSGATATTTQADELVVGAVSVAGPSSDSFTADGNFSGGPFRLSQDSGSYPRTLNTEYRIVSATGTYTYAPTLGTSRLWADAIATYKAAAPSTINISGSCKQNDQTTDCTDAGAGDTIKVAVNGTLQGQTQATVSGTWSISSVTEPTSGDVITVFIDGAASGAKKAVAVTKYDGAGDITGVALIEEHLTVGSDENQTISNTDLSQYDNSVSSDADVFYEVDASNDLTVDTLGGLGNDELYIQAGNTYRPDSASSGNVTTHNLENNGTIIADGNTFNLTGTWDNNNVFTAGTSTVTLFANTNNYYFYPGASSYYNVTIDSNGYFFYLGNNVTISNTFLYKDSGGVGTLSLAAHTVTTKDFTWQAGFLSTGAYIIDISGNFINSGGGYFGGAGLTTIRFNGAGDSIFNPGTLTHGNVTINKDNQTDAVSVSSNPLKMAASTSLDITSGILDIAGNNLDIGASSAFSNTGTLRLQGGETISNLTNDINSGTVLYNGAATPYTGLAVGDTYYHLTFNGTGTWNLDAALDVDGNFDITSGTVNASGFNINVAGNWNKLGTFSHGGGTQTVTLDGTGQAINGSTTFYNLSKSVVATDTLTFDATGAQSIATAGNVSFSGTAGNLLLLRSSSTPTQWGFNVDAGATTDIYYIDVQDSNASAGAAVTAYFSQQPGANNLNWVFENLQLVKQVWSSGGSPACLASRPAKADCNRTIFNATTTARSDAFDGDTGSDEFTGINTGLSPDNLTAGGDGGAGNNDTINIPANKTFAIRFQATKN